MKLLMHPASPNVRAVRVTAAHLDIPLECQLIDAMAGEQSLPNYLAINPNGLFPVLVDEDFVLWETVPIMQYIAAKRPGNALWPPDERRRADICRWQCWSLAHWSPALGVYIFENYFKRLKGMGEPNPEVLQNGEPNFHRFARVLNDQLKKTPYVAGDVLTLADLSAACCLMYSEPARIPLQGYSEIQEWLRRITALPAWQQTEPRH
jgi:glutathione S-transferase